MIAHAHIHRDRERESERIEKVFSVKYFSSSAILVPSNSSIQRWRSGAEVKESEKSNFEWSLAVQVVAQNY